MPVASGVCTEVGQVKSVQGKKDHMNVFIQDSSWQWCVFQKRPKSIWLRNCVESRKRAMPPIVAQICTNAEAGTTTINKTTKMRRRMKDGPTNPPAGEGSAICKKIYPSFTPSVFHPASDLGVCETRRGSFWRYVEWKIQTENQQNCFSFTWTRWRAEGEVAETGVWKRKSVCVGANV